MLKNIVMVLIIIIAPSCNEDVINTHQPDRKGKISGFIIDSINSFPLQSIEIVLNYSNLTSMTDSNGYFVFKDIPFGNYKVFIETVGYIKEEIDIALNDTLHNINNILLRRKKYSFDTITYSELPDLMRPDSTYYKLSYYSFEFKFLNHYWNSPYWDSIYVNNFIDSLIIGMKRLNIDVDTLWYQSFEIQCSDPTVSFLPKIAVKLREPDNKMYILNFESPEPDSQLIFLIWEYCEQKPMHYRKYYLFN